MTIPDIRRANKSQTAEFFDVSLPTVENWIRKGAPVHERGSRGVSWVLDLRAIAQWLYEGQDGGEADPDRMAPQDRKAWFDSESRRIDLEVRARRLIPQEDVERVFSTGLASLRQDILAIPDRLERQGTSPQTADIVQRALHEALAAVAARFAELGRGGEQ